MHWPKTNYFLLFKVITAVLFVSLFAQLEIKLPLNEADLSISGQTFAVLLVGFILGSKLAIIAMLLYLVCGALGLPIFSGGGSGLDTLWGTSAGYLYGFVIAAGLVGKIKETRHVESLFSSIILMFLGTIVILTLGSLWLSYSMGLGAAIIHGIKPFLLGGIIKSVLGGIVAFIWTSYIEPKISI